MPLINQTIIVMFAYALRKVSNIKFEDEQSIP